MTVALRRRLSRGNGILLRRTRCGGQVGRTLHGTRYFSFGPLPRFTFLGNARLHSSDRALGSFAADRLQQIIDGVNLECLVCGEFVLHRVDGIACPECGAEYGEPAEPRLQLSSQAG